jgi:hypothetical protein
MNREYATAAICRRGHVQVSDLDMGGVSKRCPTCGQEILTKCPACGAPIRGRRIGSQLIYNRPDFCDECGAGFPWIGRAGLIYELQNRLADQGLDPADELIVSEQLDALIDGDLNDEGQINRWSRVKNLAPRLWETSEPILETLIAATIKSQL